MLSQECDGYEKEKKRAQKQVNRKHKKNVNIFIVVLMTANRNQKRKWYAEYYKRNHFKRKVAATTSFRSNLN